MEVALCIFVFLLCNFLVVFRWFCPPMWPLSWSIFLALLSRSSCLGHFSIDFVVSRGPCPLSFPRLSPTLGQQLLSQLELYSLETAHWKWNRRQLNVFCFLVDDDNLISFQNCFGFIAWIQSNCRFVNLTSCTAAKFIASSSECSQSIRGLIKPSRFIK